MADEIQEILQVCEVQAPDKANDKELAESRVVDGPRIMQTPLELYTAWFLPFSFTPVHGAPDVPDVPRP